MVFNDNEFETWYCNLSNEDRQKVWEEIHNIMERCINQYFQTFTNIKDIILGEPIVNDVFSPVNLNRNQFIDYLWNNKEELK